MKIKFDTKKLEKQILEVAKKSKIEFTCPKCELYIWDYSLDELEKNPEVYCNNCGTLINYDVKIK